MNKTIAEQFIDEWAKYGGRDCIANAISRLESRLSAIENPPKQEMPEWFENIENRLSALGKKNDLVQQALGELNDHLSALEQKPAETEREWISLPEEEDEAWIFYPDGYICHGEMSGMVRGYTHWMPYRKGDKKPEPPKMGGE